jgi:hypothetical protein
LTGVEDVVVGRPYLGARLILPQIVPDVFHGVQFRGIEWQGQQCDVARNHERLASLMPAGFVAVEGGVSPRREPTGAPM